MKLIFADQAWDDCLYWQQHDKKVVKRINELIRETARGPFTGIGKPEPLRHALAGSGHAGSRMSTAWSTAASQEHS